MNKMPHLFQITIMVICTVYIGYFFYGHWDNLHITFDFGWKRISLIVFILSIYYAVYARRMKRVIEECTECSINSAKWLYLIVIGRFLNSIFPQAGNVYRGVQLKNNMGVSYTHYIASSLSFLWLDIIFNFLMATILLVPLFGFVQSPESLSLFYISFASLVSVTVIPFIIWIWRDQMFDIFLSKTGKLGQKLNILFDSSIKLIHRRKFLLEFILLSILAALLMVFVFREIFHAFDVYPNFISLVIFFVFYRLTILVTFTPGNLGIREVGNGTISSLLLGDFAVGVLFTFALRIFTYLTLSIIALLLFCMETGNALKSRGNL